MVVSKARQVEISQRRHQAVQMRIAGVSPTVIAERLGYSGAAAVSKDVDRALQKAAKQEHMASETLLKMEIDRLDRIMASLWPKVLKGDINACEAALKVINKRSSLLGLDLINRNGVADTDMASLLGNLLLTLQKRHDVPDPDMDAILDIDVISEIGTGDEE
ncbi:hypothetical protein [Planotetraspora phitsanulokensis]|uniref:Homeodomain-like domain-containing protein n=1 Tax=Planotetraspora phitsanulokensis TaxID=575192 RepID=A0A8J3UCH5_9ACTN|nr:hypothetical protein [Planotetraspora phitsanulokensis]GII42943.1 hypothetical protein Pph01_79460 [Planotetraspora phitsanulokensis]